MPPPKNIVWTRKTFRGRAGDEADLITQSIHIGGDKGLLPGIRVKVTVGATVGAEGDVEIEGVIQCHVFMCACVMCSSVMCACLCVKWYGSGGMTGQTHQQGDGAKQEQPHGQAQAKELGGQANTKWQELANQAGDIIESQDRAGLSRHG